MSEQNLPEINLEIADGALKIRTPKIVYRITLEGQGPAPASLAPGGPGGPRLAGARRTGRRSGQATGAHGPGRGPASPPRPVTRARPRIITAT